jgi:lysozyme family protein
MPRDARSLETLRSQINAFAPGRDKSTDGTTASAQHTAQNPNSDHEPGADGIVTALDITNDPNDGVDAGLLADQLRVSKDSRIKYVISNARIFTSSEAVRVHKMQGPAWEWRPYSGVNAHRSHFHISVMDETADDTRLWAVSATNKPTVASAQRIKMGQEIVNFEAQRDSQGRIQVYRPPANDGGGAYEVAGINVRWHATKAEQLASLIDAGHFQEAENAARDYVISYTAPMSALTNDAGVEFYLRDCYFNRGPGGAVRILQRALAVEDDGVVGPITRAALASKSPDQLLTALRVAREDYERNVVGYRANFWTGLINRFDRALATARRFQSEQPKEPPVAEPLPSNQSPTTLTIDLERTIQSIQAILQLVEQFKNTPRLPSAPQLPPPVVEPPPPVVVAPATPVLKQSGTQIGTIISIAVFAMQLFGILPPGIGEAATNAGQGLSFLAGAAPVAGATGIFGTIGGLLGKLFR